MPLVIQLTDDEKFLWKDLEIQETLKMQKIPLLVWHGFDIEKAFIFSDLDYRR